MFDSITGKLNDAFSSINRGRLNEANIREGMKQVRQALLEADVNYDVARDFMKRVTEQAVGDKVLKSLRPSEQIVGIVYQELVLLLGGDPRESEFSPRPTSAELGVKRDGLTVIMMCGLQGSGKTTTCGKLARALKQEKLETVLVAADLQRPAAIEQLKTLGGQLDVEVYAEDPASSSPVQVCRNGVKHARKSGAQVVILDTAGRLHVDDDLMRELRQIDNKCAPDSAIYVADAMTGQDAVNSAIAFNDALELDGVILTKTDGDTRGGAALSIRAVTGVPLKFIGTGETLDGLEAFHPTRMAQRILGGGDMGTLLEKAQREFDGEELEDAQRKMAEGKFDLNDFRKQMGMIGKLGSMRSIMKMIPGMGQMADLDPNVDMEKELRHVGGIIDAMTPDERRNPDQIDRSRRNRIARGAGSDPADVNKLLKDFKGMAGAMQGISQKGSMRDRMKAVQEMAGQAAANPGGRIAQDKQRSKRGPQDKASLREKKKKERQRAKKQRKKKR
ncbi:signal recognition particle protein [Stratiformator vulcanicus]|uniref:Signal recognition particle protein n=1 Tax=Stratiformator vulcanicus TaxID=2527980 RepID=A0A517R0D3_9PLAN|nr:signal recognition particle protein [Stratiformator vulcanicus]QDT37357.1 Signal recognition particle protein [Stratiformator vulcanicus]